MATSRIFATHLDGATLIVTPTGPISNLAGQEVEPEWDKVMAFVHEGQCRNVLVDMEKVSFFGSVLLGALNAMWKQVRKHEGRMALCNLSGLGSEIIHAAKFDTLWEIYPTRDEALKALGRS
jgi:anti-anti-sigma factor